jgi:putative ABC transport system substrate-binding protein
MRRRAFIAAFAGAAAWPLAARAKQRAGIPRIGFLGIDPPSVLKSRVEALREGLHDLGYTEGKNIVVHFRYADGNYDRLPH